MSATFVFKSSPSSIKTLLAAFGAPRHRPSIMPCAGARQAYRDGRGRATRSRRELGTSNATMRVLGIETTCDETAAAVVRLRPDGAGEILADEVMSQIAAHSPYGGVVPEIAARAHVEIVDALVARALRRAEMRARDLDGVAAAAGPGLIGGVLVGLMTGKGIALAAGKPFLAVNHLEAHALTRGSSGRLAFPYLLLLASGGHTQILAVKGVGDYDRLGDDDGRRDRRGVRQDRQDARPALSRRPRGRSGRAGRRSPPASPCRARCSAGRTPISRSPG